jgi:hypothetical protein
MSKNHGVWKKTPLLMATLFSTLAWGEARFTESESKWLTASAPVVMYARQQLLPIDIIIQPQNSPGHAPMSMAFLNGRCKLVLSMRGNPSADEVVESIAPELFEAVAQAIAAHEVAHCWRFTHGANSTMAAGFIDHVGTEIGKKGFSQTMQSVEDSRAEEGFADLFGLAWTKTKHPEQYAQVHNWFTYKREYQRVPGGHHDTRIWVKLAKDPAIFKTAATPFEQVLAPWTQGLLSELAEY